jgi:hypothetical protein
MCCYRSSLLHRALAIDPAQRPGLAELVSELSSISAG